ncbi:hypothetical protein HYY72_01145 [Candidatus Woesearchaeota archaeon]|nr:hypothetical protein [Candidatus Woesearchaeota archaeon]
MLKTLKFFFMGFHKGAMNIMLHAAGLAMLVIGASSRNIMLIASAVLLAEAGHLYNHFTRIVKYEQGVIPIQAAFSILLIAILMLVFGWFA